MTPKYLALIGGGVTVIGGGATGAYFLMPEKEKPQVSKQPEAIAPTDLRMALKGVVFLNIEGDSHKEQWGKLVDKFLTPETGVKKIVTSEIKTEEASTNRDSNIKALKKAYEELLKKTDFQEEDKTIAKNWCASSSPLLAVPGQA